MIRTLDTFRYYVLSKLDVRDRNSKSFFISSIKQSIYVSHLNFGSFFFKHKTPFFIYKHWKFCVNFKLVINEICIFETLSLLKIIVLIQIYTHFFLFLRLLNGTEPEKQSVSDLQQQLAFFQLLATLAYMATSGGNFSRPSGIRRFWS